MKSEETNNCSCEHKFNKHHGHHSHSNPIYGLGVIGALFYYLQTASGFSAILMGIFKAVFWPAVLMFELLSYLQI